MVAILLFVTASATLGQTSNLTYSATFTTELQAPGRLAPAPGGGVYVTDQLAGRVVQYAGNGSLVATYPIAQLPVGIAVHPNGRIFVSRRDGAVGVYDASFALQGVLNPAPATMTEPNDLAIHPVNGEIYVADSAAHRILVFDPSTNALARMWGTEGSDLGEFESPQAIAIDPARNLVIVADVDNFRVQVFDTAGILHFKFGYRTLYLTNSEVAWFARSEGLAVDACGNVYVSDALMGTIRAFSPIGKELSTSFVPLVTFGTGLGQLRVPCDLMITDDNRLYAADTNTSAVEVYNVTCTQARAVANSLASDGDEGSGVPLDLDGQASAATVDALLGDILPQSGSYPYPLQPPHMLDYRYTCSRCHDMDGAPAGGMVTAAGQENLCLSCHTTSGRAMATMIGGADKHNSHPWGVAASNPPAVPGPAPDSEIALHLDNGNVRCGTCHNPHESDSTDGQYLRDSVLDGGLCGQCHTEVAQWQQAGHSDVNADPWKHYDWALSNRSACRKCHSGYGYIDSSNGVAAAQQRGQFRVADCLVCHSAHGKSQDADLLRVYNKVTLPQDGPDLTLTAAGPSATCMSCHNGRTSPADRSATSVSIPHHSPASETLQGMNGITFGNTLQSSPHEILASCTACHMAPTPAAGQPGAGKIGEHTFKMKVTDATDPDVGVENVQNACNTAACHGAGGAGLTTLNRTAFGDYDGDGTIEGVQDETEGLVDLVKAQLLAKGATQITGNPYWSVAGVAPANLQLAKDAIWNWMLVTSSGDLGIHNTAYTVGLLQVTYKALTGVDVPGALLRYDTPITSLSKTNVVITGVNGGAAVQPAGAFSVNFTVKDDSGANITKSALNRLRIYVSGPSTNYQRVVPQDSTLANFVQNPDGSYTYTKPTPFPTTYSAPLNDSAAFGTGDGELTGQPLQDGTYTVLIEARRSLSGVNKAGDATLDFVVDTDGVDPPALAPRQVVNRETCNKCHNDLQIHGGGRLAVTGCVVCHNAGAEDAITNPASTPGVTINFNDMIHRLHRGGSLPRVAATAKGTDPYHYVISGFGGSPADFSDVGFPILPNGVMKCSACHDGAPQGGQIYANESITRAKCSTCHDDIDFTTGTILDPANAAVIAGTLTQADLSNAAYRRTPDAIPHVFADDSLCWACHGPGMTWDVEKEHQHITDPAKDGLQPAIEIVSVTGMTGGGGTYFQANDRPRIQFKLRNKNANPLQLVTNNKSIADSLSFIVAGPTSLYQAIIPSTSVWSSGKLSASVPPADWIDHFSTDGTYTYVGKVLPANFPAQLNSIGRVPASQIFPFEGGWGQQYTAAGTPLSAGTYTVIGFGRRIASDGTTRESIATSTYDFAFGAADPVVPYAGTVETSSCNACHGNMSFHGNQREGVRTCVACHTAGGQDGGTVTGTTNTIDLRVMIHKLHNARNLPSVLGGGMYQLNGYSGIADFSDLLISSMPGEAAECHVCHTTNAWKSLPTRDNMRSWMVACTSCHDGAETAAHVQSATLSGTFVETCTSCHGEGAAWSIERMHKSP